MQKMRNFTLRTNAVVNRVLIDRNSGKARGLSFIDTTNNQEYEVFGKAIVLGASMVESLRILFNSRNPEFPQGLANSSGTLGRYLMEHVAFNQLSGFFPELAGRPSTNDDGPGANSLYIPRFNYGEKNNKFLRGYRFTVETGCSMGPGPGAELPGFGSAYKKRIKELYPAAVNIGGYGEGLPFEWNFVEIDPDGLTDRFGIPQVRFHTNAEYDNAFALRDEMYGQMEEILRASGAELLPYEKRNPYPMGSVTHEAGGARMGDDPKKSVLDGWNRCHDIKNLLVVDAAAFVSHPEKSITLTIMALAIRASEHLAEELRLSA
jgi:choline dehydrogenase-like flavoprotein